MQCSGFQNSCLIDGTAANVGVSVCPLGLRVRVNSVLRTTALINVDLQVSKAAENTA